MSTSGKDPTLRYALVQSVTEIGLGSLLHAFRVPLRGHLLTLNQAVLLTWAIRSAPHRREAVRRSSAVSTLAALAKSLSPAGQRLFPMLAIAVQGWLYTLGVALVGLNPLGVALGAAGLAVWPFAQPLLVAYFLFGAPWFEAWARLWQKISTPLELDPALGWQVLAAGVGAYLFTASALAVAAWYARPEHERRYLDRLQQQKGIRFHFDAQRVNSPQAPAWHLALQDLLHPWFILSTLFGLSAFWFSGAASEPQVFLYLVRVLLFGWLGFWLVRAFQQIPPARLERWFTRFPALARSHAALNVALGQISESQETSDKKHVTQR